MLPVVLGLSTVVLGFVVTCLPVGLPRRAPLPALQECACKCVCEVQLPNGPSPDFTLLFAVAAFGVAVVFFCGFVSGSFVGWLSCAREKVGLTPRGKGVFGGVRALAQG